MRTHAAGRVTSFDHLMNRSNFPFCRGHACPVQVSGLRQLLEFGLFHGEPAHHDQIAGISSSKGTLVSVGRMAASKAMLNNVTQHSPLRAMCSCNSNMNNIKDMLSRTLDGEDFS